MDDSNSNVQRNGAPPPPETDPQSVAEAGARVRRLADLLSAVADVNTLISATGSDEALAQVARGARYLAEADAAAVLLPADRHLSVRSVDGVDATALKSLCQAFGPRLTMSVVRSPSTWVTATLTRDVNDEGGAVDATFGPAIFVPLTVRNRVVAVVLTVRRDARRVFTASDVAVLEAFVAQAGLTVESHLSRSLLVHDALSLSRGGRIGRQRTAHAGVSRVARGPALGQALGGLSRTAVELTSVAACTIELVEPDLSTFVGGSYGLPDGLVAATERASRQHGRQLAVECALTEKQMVLVNERHRLLVDPRYAEVREVVANEPWDSIGCLPIVSGGHRGALCFFFQATTRPSESDLDCLRITASQAASVVANAGRMAAGDESAVRGERDRLARELHDSVSQALYGIVLAARTALSDLDVDTARVGEVLGYLLGQAEEGLAELRGVISELRPEPPARGALARALRHQLERIRVLQGVAVSSDIDPLPNSAAESRQAVYRIAQEALSNAARHAMARHVELRLTVDETEFALDVRDDGRGFDPSDGFPGHFGLRSMHERALTLGGTFEVTSEPGRGTRIHVTIPMFPMGLEG